RSSIRQCIENLQNEAINKKNEVYNEWAEAFEEIELLWHLCELLHLDIVPADAVLPRLLEWIQFHWSEYDVKASALLGECVSRGAELRHSDYWQLVTKLLLHGKFQAARALLRLHSKADTPPFLEAEYLLRVIPVYSVYGGLSVSEFNGRWKGWKSAVRSKMKAATFVSYPQLNTIMSIVGDEELPLDEVKPHCGTWYELMTALLLFSEPTVKSHDLSYHAGRCISLYGGSASLRLADHVILALLDSDINGAVRKLQMMIDGGWCAVHLGNLLDLTGYFTKSDPRERIHMETLLIDYGRMLMSHQSLWQVGIAYLEYCPDYGLATLETLLEKIPLNTEKKALKVFNIAHKLGLKNVGTSVCRVMGNKCLKRGEVGGALTWALMSNDGEFATIAADVYLRRYVLEADLAECSNTLLHLGQSILLSPRLTFLAKYCEFHELYKKDDLKEAAALLVRLLDSNVSPRYFWLTLLSDSLPLFETDAGTDSSVFSHSDTMVLSSCLEELVSEMHDSPTPPPPALQEKIRTIRMAIAKNIDKTLISELCSANLSANSHTKVYKCY
ncbi:hypothetical protein AAG570_005416, partial [Ranatra chinensis]